MNFQGQLAVSFIDIFFAGLFVVCHVSRARMKTIWGMKFSFALRTAFAALLASIYAMHPEVFWTEIMKQDDQPFLPVFVSFCMFVVV